MHMQGHCARHTALMLASTPCAEEARLPQTGTLHNARNHANDPSAGSPTETLLRLLLPLSDKVH